MNFWELLFRLAFGGRQKPSSAPKPPQQRPQAPAPAPPPPVDVQPQPPAPPPTQQPPEPPPEPPPLEVRPPAPPPPPIVQPPPSSAAPVATIELGCVDANVDDQSCTAFLQEVERTTRVSLADIRDTPDKVTTKRLPAAPAEALSIAQVQQGLTALGFFPGGRADGICGYRTQSAIRLFQEYLRSVEGQDILPDGKFGARTGAHLQRWIASGQRPNWAPRAGEYEAWLALLERVKQNYLAEPSALIQKVNAFTGASDTRKPADWDFTGAGAIHLIGIRRDQFSNKFDDIFVLLMKGLVFKFQGSTEPGASSHPEGPPHLVPGQHNYHFGWHQRSYLALRPLGPGVLVIRAGADKRLDEADLEKPLQPNATINIHWGGRGMAGDVNNWSEGCQVITGTVYMNPAGQLVNCQSFAAVRSGEPQTPGSGKTRGAYNVLVDLVTALSGDMPSNIVKYTLLTEPDLALAPDLERSLADARERVLAMAT